MSNSYRGKKIISIIAILYFFLRFIYGFFPVVYEFFLLILIVELSPACLIKSKLLGKVKFSSLLGFLSLIPVILISLFVNNVNVLSLIIYTSLNLYLGYWIAKYGMDRKLAIILFILISVILAIRIIITKSVDLVFIYTSRNSISSFSILTSILVYSSYNRDDVLPLYPAIVTLFFALIGEGRGGVISALTLLIGIILINMLTQKDMKIKDLSTAFVIAILFYVLISQFYDKIAGKAVARFFSQNYFENERVEILKLYIQLVKENFRYFVFGVPTDVIPIVEYLNGNFHNSFLTLHSSYGILGFLTVLYYLGRSFLKSLRNKFFIRILLLLVVCIRIFTDSLCFVGYYDVIFYFLIISSNLEFVTGFLTI